MRFLAASDMHGNEVVTRDLARKAEKDKVDLVVLAGDVTYFGEYATNIIKPFLDKKKSVLFVAGNHEMPDVAESITEYYKIADLQKKSAMVGGVGFFGCGGANIMPYYVSDEEMFRILKKGFQNVKDAKKKVMVTHVHPAGSAAEKFSGFPGSKGVRKAIDQFRPDIHIFGHLHDFEGLEQKIGKTYCFTVGKRGRVVEI